MTMTNDRQATCEERIRQQMKGREDYLSAVFSVLDESVVCTHCGEKITAEDEDLWVHEGGRIPCDWEAFAEWGAKVEELGGDADIDAFPYNKATAPESITDEDLTDDESAYGRLHELPLGVSTYRVMRIDLSTGGPADWLEVKLADRFHVESVTYHFADWFDHAERPVERDEALWRLAEFYAEMGE